MAIGSAAEVDTQIVIAFELDYIAEQEMKQIENLITEIRKMSYSLISRLSPTNHQPLTTNH
jgi:four helix bundle protein